MYLYNILPFGITYYVPSLFFLFFLCITDLVHGTISIASGGGNERHTIYFAIVSGQKRIHDNMFITFHFAILGVTMAIKIGTLGDKDCKKLKAAFASGLAFILMGVRLTSTETSTLIAHLGTVN